MYTVIVADDEQPILDWLATGVDWAAHGLRLLLTVDDGAKAYDAILTHRPDVMIMDVVMPGLDGLQVIESAAGMSPNTEFIILSGHSRFEYAERAVRLGVKRYLVKPLDEQDLASALADVVLRLDARRQQESRLATANREIATLRPLARREAFRSWITAAVEGRAIPNSLRRLLGLPSALAQIIVCRVSTRCSADDLSRMQKECERIIGARASTCATVGREIVLVTRPLHDAGIGGRIRSTLWRVSEHGERISIRVSETVRPHRLPWVYDRIRRELDSQTASTAESARADAYRGDWSAGDADLARALAVAERELAERTGELQSNVRSAVVRRMLQAVVDNAGCPTLSLRWLATHIVFGNAEYLGRVFHRETGMRFSEYVNRARINLAKTILRSPGNHKIAAIALAVGFGDNPQYFSHVFRRTTGLSPSQCRERTRDRALAE